MQQNYKSQSPAGITVGQAISYLVIQLFNVLSNFLYYLLTINPDEYIIQLYIEALYFQEAFEMFVLQQNAGKIARADNARYIQDLQYEMKRINEDMETQRKVAMTLCRQNRFRNKPAF